MKHIKDSEELMTVLCGAAEGCGAYGAGEITVQPKGGGDFVKTYGGGIVKTAAVISAGGYGGRAALLKAVDGAAERLCAFKGEGVLAVRAPYPARAAEADDSGFIRFEREIEIIYAGGI